MVHIRRCLVASLVAAFAIISLAQGPVPSPFMRMQKPTATEEVLQTKAREYMPANGVGPVIWLVGVAHVGEEAYYKELQKLLDAQTTVLYEGVTRKGVDPTKESADQLQKSTYQTLSEGLHLQFQLYGIDYKRPGFRNADLSWDELSAIEAKYPPAKGGMNLATIGSLLNANSDQGKQLAAAMSMIKDDPSSVEAMHLIMIETLSDPTVIERTLSPNLNDLLIRARNAKVLAALKSTIPENPKSIAIFFGAGHMADMEKHVEADFGYLPGEGRWYTAIEGDTKKVTSGNGQTMLQMMRSVLQGKKKGG